MIKKYCDMCHKEVTNDNYYDFEISHKSKEEKDVFELMSWGEKQLCDNCYDQIMEYVNHSRELHLEDKYVERFGMPAEKGKK